MLIHHILQKKADLASLKKSAVEKLDIGKLIKLTSGLNSLNNKVENIDTDEVQGAPFRDEVKRWS